MLYYFGIANLPTKMAHSIQEMRMCEAFVEAGEEVTYCHYHVLGEQKGHITWRDIAEYYGLENEFSIKTFRSLHGKTGRFSKIGTVSWVGPMTAYVFAYTLVGRLSEEDIIYGREYYPLYFLTELFRLLPEKRRPKIYFEQHTPVSKRFTERFYQRIDGVVSITEKLASHLVAEHPIDRSRILVAPDGVNLSPFTNISKAEARKKLELPANKDIVMYTGHLYEGKGVETLVEAVKRVDTLVYVVGGYDEDIERIKQDVGHPENVIFTGFVDPSEIPIYQLASDVLVAPYTEDSRPWVSPLKLFEYMAAEKPILASDREVLQEVLTDSENAIIFEKGNTESLCAGLEGVLNDDTLAEILARQARKDVEQYTWKTRAERILSFTR